MKAVCYCRTSTLDQAREEKTSIPDQLKWAKTLALEKGWEWKGEYIEPGVFGDVELEEREALSNLWKDAKNGNFDIVLIYHSSRFAREADIGMRVCRMLGQIRVQTYFRNSPIEPVAPDKFSWGMNIGSLYMMAFSFIGDFQENVARSERVRSGFQGLARRGVLTFAPYGYKKIPKIFTDKDGRQRYTWGFEVDPLKALIVQRIFNEYVKEGGSLRQIMLSLNKEGVLSPSGKIGEEAWSSSTIRNILTNPAYIGTVRWGRKLGGKYLQGKSLSGKQRRIVTLQRDWITEPGDHPKIIMDKELFDKAQVKLRLRYSLKGRAIASKGLLIGLIKCGRCGKNGYYKTRILKRKNNLVRSDYLCSSYITYKSCQRHIMAAKKLDGIIISNIAKIVSNLAYRKKLLSQNGKNKDTNFKEKLETLNRAKKETEIKQHRILIAYETGTLELEVFG